MTLDDVDALLRGYHDANTTPSTPTTTTTTEVKADAPAQ